MNRDPLTFLRLGEKLDGQIVFRASGTAKNEFEGICRKHRLTPGLVHRRLVEHFNEQYREKGAQSLLRLLPSPQRRRGR